MAEAVPVRCVVLGAGLRGRQVYGRHALEHPQQLRVVALAEPCAERREAMAREHGLSAEDTFADWRELLERPQRAELAVVATGDTLHVGPALAAFEGGYHVLLEKPIAPDPGECLRVVEAAERSGRLLFVSHVLRFTPFYAGIHGIVSSGRLGRLVHLDLREHVATWHMVHSFVRGKFRSRALAAPFLLAKSCHDLDLLVWLAGAPARCSDGCPVQESCPHDAVRFYLGPDDALARGWPWSDLGPDPSRAARRQALESGPFGRCVYRCDNDVADHQVVAVEFEGGSTGSFAVHGHATRECRTLRITGSAGELRGNLESGEIEISRHGAFEVERRRLEQSPLGHFGGDLALLTHVIDAVRAGDPGDARASGRTALTSHLLGFAAEQAREGGRVVDVRAFGDALETAAGAP